MELRSILETTTVGALALEEAPVVAPTDPLSTVAARMRGTRHGSALICENGCFAGIFTERDLIRCLAEEQSWDTPVGAVMSRDPHTVRGDDSLLQAVRRMDRENCRRLPVVPGTGSGPPRAILDVKDVVQRLVEHFPSAVYNQSAHGTTLPKRREGA